MQLGENGMTNTALITGASGGIGEELARLHAKKGGDVILVARSKTKLNELANELIHLYSIKALVIAEDLSDPQSAQRIFDQTQALGVQVDVLINNAGFGGHGKFHERDLSADQAMMQVNMTSLTGLTHHYLQGMVERNQGQILNVSSTAGFLPGPLQAVYYATKAYVNSFSLALAEEVKDRNITVTALCPGPVATGFAQAGDLDGVGAFKNAKSPESVAYVGYKAMEKGKLVAINEKGLSFMLNWVVPFLPRKVVLKLSRQAMEKSV